MKNYRVRRPKQFEELMNLLKDKESGVFSTLKSALIFAAALGFKHKKRLEFTDTSEPIAITLFSDHQDQPFMYMLALTELNDVSYLRNENFSEVMRVFEEYAAGGLQFLDDYLDKNNIKESIEGLLAENGHENLIDDITKGW